MNSTARQVLNDVSRKQRGFWITLLSWWMCVAAFVLIVSHFFRNAPDAFITVPVYLSILVLYVPLIRLYRLKCPHCNGSMGALPFLRYRSLSCRACGKRIDCNG
jgi:hypothetical protein